MKAHADAKHHVGRFDALLAEGACPRPIYDEVLLETHGCVVTPTLGSILPNWLLIIPRTPAINFARWESADGTQPHDLIRTILAKHDIASHRVVWFEHGPSEEGSSIGCGIDHAHLHLLLDAPFSFQDFISSVMAHSRLRWQGTSAQAAHRSVDTNRSYLIAASEDHAFFAEQVDNVGSQFFRRVIADLVDQSQAWDYRTHPHWQNVQETVRTFGS